MTFLQGILDWFKSGEVVGVLSTLLIALAPYAGIINSTVSKCVGKFNASLPKVNERLDDAQNLIKDLQAKITDLNAKLDNLTNATVIAYTNSNLTNATKTQIIQAVAVDNQCKVNSTNEKIAEQEKTEAKEVDLTEIKSVSEDEITMG